MPDDDSNDSISISAISSDEWLAVSEEAFKRKVISEFEKSRSKRHKIMDRIVSESKECLNRHEKLESLIGGVSTQVASVNTTVTSLNNYMRGDEHIASDNGIIGDLNGLKDMVNSLDKWKATVEAKKDTSKASFATILAIGAIIAAVAAPIIEKILK